MSNNTEIINNIRKRRFRPNKNFMMFVVSLVLGVAGVYFSKQFIEEKLAFYKGQLQQTEEMVKVVVVARNMRHGDVIRPNDLVLREVVAKYAHETSVLEMNHENAIGQRLSFDIAKGKPLLWAHLEGGYNATFSGKVAEGLRALTVPVDEINSISGFLQPNDNIDLFMTHIQGKEKIILPLMQNLHVMATGVRTRIDKSGQGNTKTYRTITVQVTPQEAKRIILARDTGKVTATLRNPDDNNAIDPTGLSVSQLLGKKPSKPRKPAKRGIEFIVGGV